MVTIVGTFLSYIGIMHRKKANEYISILVPVLHDRNIAKDIRESNNGKSKA